jgi:hypothetical protein
VTAALFVDTSAWFAYVNRGDRHHEAVRELLDRHAGRLVTSNYVFDESVTLCRRRLGHAAATRLGEALLDLSLVDLVRVSHADEATAWRLFCQRPDREYSFTDCLSFTLMRRLRLTRAAALDDDFAAEGFTVAP